MPARNKPPVRKMWAMQTKFHWHNKVSKGVAEIDMVMNYGYARSGKWDEVKKGIEGVVRAAGAPCGCKGDL